MVAAAVTELEMFLSKMLSLNIKTINFQIKRMGVTFIAEKHGLRVIGPDKLKATDIKTMPHPGFFPHNCIASTITIAQCCGLKYEHSEGNGI